jgi:Zn-dependent protease
VPGTLQIGSFGGVGIHVRSSWLLVAVLIAFVLQPRIEQVAPGLGALAYVAGAAFAVLLYFSVLLHEVSHALVAQALGMRVRAVTLTFLGGHTEIEGEMRRPRDEFLMSVVGPLTSLAVAAAAWGVTGLLSGGLILFATETLAVANLVIGVLNLVPGLPLDGGRMLRAGAWAATGRPHLATVIAAWAGRLVALSVLAYPLVLSEGLGWSLNILDYVLAAVLASFLWAASTQSLRQAQAMRRLPQLNARPLARRALGVPAGVPLAEAVRRANEAGAGALLVVDEHGLPTAVVSEEALQATPEDRRPWLTTGSVARTLEPGMTLPADLSGAQLVRAMQQQPATEYLLVEADGSLFGVLVAADVSAAFARS